MENYPSNSHKTREQNTDKKVEKVVSGKTSTKKKSGIRKLSDTFLSEDIGNVKNYIFAEVLSGKGTQKVANDLNQKGIPSKRGGRWTATTISVGYCYQWYRYDAIW